MRAAIYVRVSTPEQTLEGQEAELLAYCQARNWQAVVFRDVQSGADATRPGAGLLMEAVRKRKVQAVVCTKLDRLGRSLSHFAAFLNELQALGVGLVCVTQGIDTVAESGRTNAAASFVSVLAAVAQFERELIRERTIDGLKAARKRGAKIGRPRKIDESTRERVERLSVKGWSVRKIAHDQRLAPSTVWRILRGEEAES